MARAKTNGIEIEHETFGDRSNPTMLLVMGFALQLHWWDDDFCRALASRGFHVVRFDNRDVGLSTKIEAAGIPNIPAVMAGDFSTVRYALDDMADDTAGLLDALGVADAHVVGMSMGGMIAQLVALRHPSRVKSLTSIMSTTGDRAVGHASPAALGAIFAPPPLERDAAIEHGVGVWRVLASPGYAFDEARFRARLAKSYDRMFYPAGPARQLAAILSARDRTLELAKVRAPTTVIHGAEDPLIGRSGGEATARAIPGAKLEIVEGMGHDLPEAIWPRVIDRIVENAAR